jgi:hypothetical protein
LTFGQDFNRSNFCLREFLSAGAILFRRGANGNSAARREAVLSDRNHVNHPGQNDEGGPERTRTRTIFKAFARGGDGTKIVSVSAVALVPARVGRTVTIARS